MIGLYHFAKFEDNLSSSKRGSLDTATGFSIWPLFKILPLALYTTKFLRVLDFVFSFPSFFLPILQGEYMINYMAVIIHWNGYALVEI